ncbi:IS5 family transposase IS1648 [Streptosporangium roseum]
MIKSVLPEGGGQGGQWRDHRQVINGILWQARTGAPWRDVPDRYRPWKTLHERLRRRTADGTWEAIFQHVKGNVQLAEDDDAAELWEVSVDSTVTRAHQHAAGARKKRGSAAIGASGATVAAVDGEALGRSRGGLTSKLHVALDDRL